MYIDRLRTFVLSLFLTTSIAVQAQWTCNWTSVFFDSFEYTTPIPHIIPGMTYQNTPQTFVGCVRTGLRGMYLNIADGQIGLLYSQPFTDLCIGQQYRFSFSTRDAFTSTNNLTFQVKDATGAVLATQTVINNNVWQDIIMPVFTANTTSISFEISTNIPGGGGNDVGFDDLRLSQCFPVTTPVTWQACNTGQTQDLFALLAGKNVSSNGTWSGPSTLSNGFLGTFDAGVHANGTYLYTIDAQPTSCADSSVQVQVQLFGTPAIAPLSAIDACGSYTLPAISGTNLVAPSYFTMPNGQGTSVAAGTVVSTTQTLYAYDGLPGCADEEPLAITVSQPSLAGNDQLLAYCGVGSTYSLSSFLSPAATPGGTWSETSLNPSGTFSASTAVFQTAGIPIGTYEFTYTTPANGACPSDEATITLEFGNFPPVNLGPDTTLCPGQTRLLNAAASGPYDTYLWNNNSTASQRLVTSAGTYWVRVGTLGDNQIINGDFEQGNTGFSTSYSLGTGGAWGLVSNPSTYAIATSPNLAHANFASCQDHTPAPGVNMMVVNGSGTPNSNVWCQNVPVQTNTDYQFGAWIANALNDANVAQLQFSINNATLGNVFTTSTNACNWQQFFQVWNSGASTSAQICVVNQNTSGGGNDFLLDDITFRPICFDYDTVVVSYSTNPVVALGADLTVCETDTVALDAGNAGADFVWTTGATTQELLVADAGTYSVTVTNAAGCSGSDQIVISHEVLPEAGANANTMVCETDGVLDLNTLLSNGADSDGIWEDLDQTLAANLTSSGQLTLSGSAGDHLVYYVSAGTMCPNDTAMVAVSVHNQPVAAPLTELDLCNSIGTTQDLNGFLAGETATVAPYWIEVTSSGQFSSQTGTLDLSGLNAGTYEFAHVLPAQAACVNDTTWVHIAITENPDIQFSVDVPRGCIPVAVSFLNETNANGSVSYAWQFGDGSTSTQISPSHVYTAVGCFDVTLTATANGLCTTSETVTDLVCVDPLPVAAFSANPMVTLSDDPTVQFANESVLNDQNFWDFGDGFSSSAEHPSHAFPLGEAGSYLVTLVVLTDAGCADTTEQIIVVKDQLNVYVPNTFTPDGDEFNNVFAPVMVDGFDPTSYELVIFDRWGEIVFISHDVSIGWDGSFQGRYAKSDTYIWELTFKADENDKMYTFRGHISLIR